jgi:hypothetical protein
MEDLLGLFGILCMALLAIPILNWLMKHGRAEWREIERVRAVGAPHVAFIKQRTGQRVHHVGLLMAIETSAGTVGKSYSLDWSRFTIPHQWIDDVCATGRAIEVLYHPSGTTILIKNPQTGEFEPRPQGGGYTLKPA